MVKFQHQMLLISQLFDIERYSSSGAIYKLFYVTVEFKLLRYITDILIIRIQMECIRTVCSVLNFRVELN